MRHKVMLVEDEPKLAALVADHLRRYGYDVHVAVRFDDLKREFVEVDPQLVLLDVNLPYFDGFYWCRQVRTVSNAPIIFVSARAGEMDQVMALDNGGDDYVVKPFNLELLTAKVRGALRRAYGEYAASTAPTDAVEAFGVTLEPARLRVSAAGGSTELSRNETVLLAALLRAGGRVVRRERLLESLWDEVDFVDDNTLTVNVTRLRTKLAEVGLSGAVRTVRGEGYRFEPTGPEPDAAPDGRGAGGPPGRRQ